MAECVDLARVDDVKNGADEEHQDGVEDIKEDLLGQEETGITCKKGGQT